MEIKLQPRFEYIAEKKLVGLRMEMSLAENKTAELWHSFMTVRKEIKNITGNELYSVQIYDTSYFQNYYPAKKFVKWASAEVSGFENVADNFENFIMPAGLYAVFHHEGMGAGIFQTIFTEWLPNSEYELDHRPHFEVLGEKYKNGSPDSEEDIWIPVKPKQK